MAPAPESSYFPPLDKSLPGEIRLISWKTAYRALCDEEAAIENTYLAKFLLDDNSIAILSSPLEPFPKPTSRSASEFDTSTAPINVSPYTNGVYDLSELKEAARWLSKEVDIEQLVALRMAIIELQERAQDQLLADTANGGVVPPMLNPLASSVLALSTSNLGAPTNAVVAQPAVDYNREEVRRKRLLAVYLSEKSHAQKLSANLLTRSAVSKSSNKRHPAGALRENVHTSWIDDVAEAIFSKSGGYEAACSNSIRAVGALLDRVNNINSWPKVFADEVNAPNYIDSQLVEVISLLRTILAMLYALHGMPSSDLVQAWFLTMEKYSYLKEGSTRFTTTEVPQLLMSIISVEILKPQLAIGEMMNAAGIETAAMDRKAYISDDKCVSYLNDFFLDCVHSDVKLASPAIYAWSIIIAVIKDIASLHSQAREPDGRERRGSVDLRSEFERIYHDAIYVTEWEIQNTDTPSRFAAAAVDKMDVYALLSIMSTASSQSFASTAESDTCFICKEALLDLVREGMSLVQYDAPILDALLSIMEPTDLIPASKKHSAVLAGKFLHDEDQLRPAVLTQALMRYPYELSPMLRLFTVLANAESKHVNPDALLPALEILEQVPIYTQTVEQNFSAYHLTDEDSGSNHIILDASLPIFATRKELLKLNPNYTQLALPWKESEDNDTRVMKVPAGTSGTIVKESRPFVLKLDHPHSALEYLGCLLSTFLASSELIPVAMGAEVDRQIATELVTLFTSLLSSTSNQWAGHEQALHNLGRLSYVFEDEQDIISVVADILEAELLAHQNQMAHEGSLSLAVSCMEFLEVIVQISPERVWSVLARSSLLGVADGTPSLASVIGGTEVPIGQYRFLSSCVRLYSLLLDDAISGVVKRKSSKTREPSRHRLQNEALDMTPDRTMSAVLDAYQKILLDAFQNLPNWKFELPSERCFINTALLSSFAKLLRSTYGVDLSKHPSKRLTNVLAPAADDLLKICAPETGTSPLADTFSKIFTDGLPVAEDAIPMHIRQLLIQQSLSAFRFLVVLLRAIKIDANLLMKQAAHGGSTNKHNERPTALAFQLLRNIPAFASLLASDHAIKYDLCELLTELIEISGLGKEDPPSILAQLDAEAQKAFLAVVTQLDRPLCDVQVERRVWDLLSAVMSGKQQWFAVYLLTGALPKKQARDPDANSIKSKPILTYALDQLSAIADLPPERAVGMLRFVATAQRTWIWPTNDVRSHKDFLKKTVAWIESLNDTPRDHSPAGQKLRAKEYEMVAYLCDIFAISLHVSLETGDKGVFKILVAKLNFLKEYGVLTTAYNRSLNMALASNLKSKFPSSELSDFKRTGVNPARYGEDYFYDRDLAARIFRHDQSWHGSPNARGRADGFVDEFARVNNNLSLVDAQKRLLESWKILATTLSEWAGQDAALQGVLARVAWLCLKENVNVRLDEPGAADIMEARIELAFVLISKLVSLKSTDRFMEELLPMAWDLVRASPVDYDIATASGDVRYYRQLLQILYLTLQPHGWAKPLPSRPTDEDGPASLRPAVASMLLDIVGKVVAPGFRALCGNLYNDVELALPADFTLLTAILQAIMTVHNISSIYTLLSDLVAGSSMVRGALSLYSWADRIAESVPGQDPAYGELAINFLLTLSTVRPIAEQMALEGVLTQLASGNLSNYFRKAGGKGPFDEPQRMFVIWTDGFLPLCLNLLDSVGPPIAAEVSAFLNSFPQQLRRAESALQNETPSVRNPQAGGVTLGLVAEAHSLCLISLILSSDQARGAADGINAADISDLMYDVETVKGLVEALTRSTRSLNNRIMPANPLEEKWSRTTVAGSSDNALQAKIMKELGSMKECFEPVKAS